MAEPQPPTIHEGATDDIETTTKPASAEDRKAAAALSNLDSSSAAENDTAQVDKAAATNALNSVSEKKAPVEAPAKSKVKVDAADVALLVDQLELTKARATELLKQHDGDAVKTIKAFLQPAF
ncbi:hypothetical protein B0T21DRAFT_279754 [Apiosordaria backusii]|uniref:Nascent polypeptide-associated complex subunit alpha-like UBA domain-containing protein n=1 Tax=Apiosordaria backusii TaxID=314023 RepID=A0AA40K794_9PEZI|nr:hypothetical protein B0T21DRAFT_279754 [Apiosordaria backusii]